MVGFLLATEMWKCVTFEKHMQGLPALTEPIKTFSHSRSSSKLAAPAPDCTTRSKDEFCTIHPDYWHGHTGASIATHVATSKLHRFYIIWSASWIYTYQEDTRTCNTNGRLALKAQLGSEDSNYEHSFGHCTWGGCSTVVLNTNDQDYISMSHFHICSHLTRVHIHSVLLLQWWLSSIRIFSGQSWGPGTRTRIVSDNNIHGQLTRDQNNRLWDNNGIWAELHANPTPECVARMHICAACAACKNLAQACMQHTYNIFVRTVPWYHTDCIILWQCDTEW